MLPHVVTREDRVATSSRTSTCTMPPTMWVSAERAAYDAILRGWRVICQKPAFRNMKSRSESRPIVGSGGGSVSWAAIMSSGRMRSGSFRKRADDAVLSWSAVLAVSTMIVTSLTVSGERNLGTSCRLRNVGYCRDLRDLADERAAVTCFLGGCR